MSETAPCALPGRSGVAPSDAEVTSETKTSFSPVATLECEQTKCNLDFGPGNESIDWQSLPGTISDTTLSLSGPQDLKSRSNSSAPDINVFPTPFTSRKSLPCPSQTSNDNRHQPRSTTISSNAPGVWGTAHNSHADGLTNNSPSSNHSINQPVTVNSADLLRRPQTWDVTLSQTQLPTPSPEEARGAIRVVIGFFEQQPSDFLELQEGIVLGKLEERLRCM
jgi:hypothetical protein